MNILRIILLCALSCLTILIECEAGRGYSSRGGGSRSRPSSSSSSSWFSSRPKPAPSPSYSRPAPSPSYGWNVPSPSRPASVPSPSSFSYPRQPAGSSYGWGGSKPPASIPKPPTNVYSPKPASNVYKPPVASAPPLQGSSYPSSASKPIGWNVAKPVGPPPAYPGLGRGTATGSNVAPPAYSRYTPKSQAPSYNSPSYAQRPNPPAYTPSVAATNTQTQGVRPYGNAGVAGANYPRQTYSSVPATQTQYGYPKQQYGTASAPVGYGQGGYGQGGYGQGGYGRAPVGPPVYNHYGGSVGYGYPSGGPTIINNHYGGGGGGFGGGYGGGYGGFGGGYGGGYGGGGGSGVASHLLTAGLFYGLGRVTAPSYGHGYSSFGSGGYGSSSRHSETNIHNTYNNYYDHGSTTTSTVLPPLQVVTDTPPVLLASGTNNNQSPDAPQQPAQNQGSSPMDIYLTQPKDPYGVIIPSNATSSTQGQGQDTNIPTFIIPRTVDLSKQKLYEPVEVPYDQVSKHKINEQPLLLNESVIRLPAYGYNFPTWNESSVVSAPLVLAAPTLLSPPPTTTAKPTEPEPTGLGAKIGKIFYNVVNWFSSGYQRDDANVKTPQVYLEDETHGRLEAEMLRRVTTTEKTLEDDKVEEAPDMSVKESQISKVIDDALARAKADIEKLHAEAGIATDGQSLNVTQS